MSQWRRDFNITVAVPETSCLQFFIFILVDKETIASIIYWLFYCDVDHGQQY